MAKKNSAYYDSLVQRYRELAKKADQRLLRLERLSKQKHFKHVKEWAYQNAMKSIHVWDGENATRFNTKPPEKTQSLLAKISDIERFLGLKSSTKRGIMKTYKQRAETLNKNHGTKFSWEDVGAFFESAEWEKMEKDYGSDTAINAVGQIQQNEDDIIQAIESGKKYNLKVKNKKVKKAVNELIKEYGLDITKLYKQ